MKSEGKSKEDWAISLQNMPEFYYLLGVYFGDGWISKNNFGLKVCDIEFLEKWRRCCLIVLGRAGNISTHTHIEEHQKNWRPSFTSSVRDVNFCDYVLELTKSKTIIPDIVKQASKECKLEFCAGFFDSEGMIAARYDGTKAAHYSATVYNTQIFIYDIRQLFLDIDLLPKKVNIEKRRTVANNTVYNFNIKLSSMFDFPIIISRKKERLDRYKILHKNRNVYRNITRDSKGRIVTTTVRCDSSI